MKQYNRIILGEGGKFIKDCLDNNYIGMNPIKDKDLSKYPHDDENTWKQEFIEKYIEVYPDKSTETAGKAVGFMWTVCYGLKKDDVVLASNGNGGYYVAEITGDYFYEKGTDLPHRRPVKWLNVVIQRSSMSQNLKNSIGSIGTCCNISKYADELEHLIVAAGGTLVKNDLQSKVEEVYKKNNNYKERCLHRLLSNYLLDKNIYSKTIFHEKSKGKQMDENEWIHPDMVGVEYNNFQDITTRSLLKATEPKEYIVLYSYELKKSIKSDHELKKCFFQALSNSSWANYGYLVAFDINDNIMEEMRRLNRAFGIGIIKLSPYKDTTEVLFSARRNELDYYTIDKLCKINDNFREFISKAIDMLNPPENYSKGVEICMRDFCDKGFSSEEEIINYCKENDIPR